MKLEVLSRKPDANPKATPLLFVHGAWHAAWCWEEHFLPYFARQGYASYALSLRSHGVSERGKALRWIRGQDYAADVIQVMNSLEKPPVLIGHSMGGYVVQKVLEKHNVPAGVLLASIPSAGTLAYLLRETLHHPLAMLKVSLTLTTYPLIETPALSKAAFFSPDMPDEQSRRYHALLQDESFMIALDTALLDRPRPERVKTPLLVLGAAHDQIFPAREVEATARDYTTQATIFPDMAHDMMLEADWQAVADTIIVWLAERGL